MAVALPGRGEDHLVELPDEGVVLLNNVSRAPPILDELDCVGDNVVPETKTVLSVRDLKNV
jgi:hypothetical protein